ncbi:hypothetical protein PGT21_027164 [Puccinia graminis f. sp. tritici]|uniref:Uncharacterized protein n=1 Tax=Puccinia graminis f. sp. tritici TaxID=56615 RepID=A0A5B0MGS0_PUCGR|nr:hypothetical protein PGT21_027164 [Puccinia graminis f. sp. tritici]KAA1126528.1 hypothetical protein PGTUg99_025331 [Puccinia graminis f. sp. tritici]
MDFDPNTGLPWGTNPFKVTSQEKYEPLFRPPQFDTGLSSNGGLDSQFNFPFLTYPNHGQVSPPAFTSSIDPTILNSFPSTFSTQSDFPFDTTLVPTPFSNLHVNGEPKAGTFSNQYAPLLPPSPVSPLQKSPARSNSDWEQRSQSQGFQPGSSAIPTSLARPSLLATSQLPASDIFSWTDDIPVLQPKSLDCPQNINQGPAINSSPSTGVAVHGFPTDFPHISPKTSITNFHADLSTFSNNTSPNYNNPFSNNAASPGDWGHSTPSGSDATRALRKTPQKSKSVANQFSSSRWQTPATTPTPEVKSNIKSIRNNSSPDSTPSKTSRKVSSSSPLTTGTNSAIFVNFTSRDSKKLLNGVAPSGSSKRKKTLDGKSTRPDNKNKRSISDDGGDAIKKRRVQSSST